MPVSMTPCQGRNGRLSTKRHCAGLARRSQLLRSLHTRGQERPELQVLGKRPRRIQQRLYSGIRGAAAHGNFRAHPHQPGVDRILVLLLRQRLLLVEARLGAVQISKHQQRTDHPYGHGSVFQSS